MRASARCECEKQKNMSKNFVTEQNSTLSGTKLRLRIWQMQIWFSSLYNFGIMIENELPMDREFEWILLHFFSQIRRFASVAT